MPWWHRGGGGKGRASPLDDNAPCRTTAVAFGDLLMFKTSHITAEPKKELTEILHMLKQSISSSETGSDVPNHKKAKKRTL